MNKKITLFYFLVLLLGGCYLLFAFMAGHNTIISHVESTKAQLVEPTEVKALDSRTTEYTLQLNGGDDAVSMALQFFSSHQYVEVYSGDELIYSLSAEPSLFGRTTGTGINVVMLPAHTSTVKVAIRTVFENSNNNQYDFYYGDAVAMYRDVIKSSFPDVIMSGLIIVLGLFMVLYWLIAHKRLGQSPSIAYFGLFSIMIGLWSLNETNLMMLIYTNRTVMSLVGYMLLMLLVIPFIQFVHYSFDQPYPKMCYTLCALSAMETIVLTILHMTDIWEFKESVRLIHIMMILGLGYMAAAVVGRIRKNGVDRKVRVNLIAVVFLSVSIVADIGAYYMGLQQTDVLGKIGILAYIILLGAESASDTFKKVEEGRKAEFYKTLAVTDVMTGLLNRSAFEEWEENCTDFAGTMLVTFDLNNLKYCNDNLGHAAGDTYIIEAARMIQRVFGSIGKCYRIGGDEFCAVIRKGAKVKIDKYLAKLCAEQEEYNRKSDCVKIQIAVGYAVHGEEDTDIEETRSHADSYMYRNKKRTKENGV